MHVFETRTAIGRECDTRFSGCVGPIITLSVKRDTLRFQGVSVPYDTKRKRGHTSRVLGVFRLLPTQLFFR